MNTLRQRLVGIGRILILVLIANVANADSPGERFRDGQRLMRSGDLTAALHTFESLREQYPWDADYSLGRAQVLLLQGRNEEALSELDDTIHLAPDYEDVWRLRFAILSQAPLGEKQQELEAAREHAAQHFPLSNWWRKADDPGTWTVLLGGGFDDLSNNLPGWNDQFIEVLYNKAQLRSFSARLGRNERYDVDDYSLGITATQTWASRWFTGAELSLANDAAFQPDWGFGVFAGSPFGEGWTGRIGFRHKAYATETVGSVLGTVEKYHGAFRFAYTINGSRLEGASTFFGHAFTTNWYFTDTSSIGVTVSTGEEAESLGNGQVLETDVTGLSLSGRHQLNDRLGLQWWVGTHEQGDFYRRQFLGMAVSIRL